MTLRDFLPRLGRSLREAAADIAYAQRRAGALARSYDRHLPHPDAAPAHYGEFLLRSSVPLLHEPPAAERLRGEAPGRPAPPHSRRQPGRPGGTGRRGR